MDLFQIEKVVQDEGVHNRDRIIKLQKILLKNLGAHNSMGQINMT